MTGRGRIRHGSPGHNLGLSYLVIFVVVLLPAVGEVVFKFISRLLPRPIQSGLRYAFRYLSKSSQRVHPPHGLILHPLSKKAWTDSRAIGLANLLCYDILMLIAPQVHYVDLINLSLASKGIRRAVFPSSEVGARAERLRMSSCENGTKSQCWVCNIQICNVR
jgi:hypothetical protein